MSHLHQIWKLLKNGKITESAKFGKYDTSYLQKKFNKMFPDPISLSRILFIAYFIYRVFSLSRILFIANSVYRVKLNKELD